MVNFSINNTPEHCTHRSMRMMRNNSETRQAHLNAERAAQMENSPVSSTRPANTINPLQTYTRINGNTIPRLTLSRYLPEFTPADCTAHLSHEEWWASLDLEIKLNIDSVMNVPGTGEHISHLDSEGRFHMINSTKMRIEADRYFAAVDRAFSQLAESMGLRFTGAGRQGMVGGDPNAFIHKAFFECPNGGEGKIVVLLPCGTKVFGTAPEGFTQVDFNEFFNNVLNELMEKISESNNEMSSSRMKRFFEEAIENLPSLIFHTN
jgi:hypothetical protein